MSRVVPLRLPGEVTAYALRRSTGERIRTASKVVYPDGREIKFLDLLPAREALTKAHAIRERELSNSHASRALRLLVISCADLLEDPRLVRALQSVVRDTADL